MSIALKIRTWSDQSLLVVAEVMSKKYQNLDEEQCSHFDNH